MADNCDDLRIHISGLRRYAMALVGNSAEADDLVQETLQRAIAYLRSGRNIRNMRGYLFSILHNVRATQLRNKWSTAVMVPIDDLVEHLPAAGNQHDVMELKSLLAAVRDLPREQQEVILLVCLEGLAYRETAAVLGIPVGTVMSRLARARTTLVRKTSETPNVGLKMVK